MDKSLIDGKLSMKPTEEELKDHADDDQQIILQQVLNSLREQTDQLTQINHRLDALQEQNSVVVEWANGKLAKRARKEQKKKQKGKSAKAKNA